MPRPPRRTVPLVGAAVVALGTLLPAAAAPAGGGTAAGGATWGTAAAGPARGAALAGAAVPAATRGAVPRPARLRAGVPAADEVAAALAAAPSDAAGVETALREALRARLGGLPPPAAPEAAAGPVVVVPLPVTAPTAVAGDLDGDGLPDVVGHRSAPDRPAVLEARRGSDGRLLWQRHASSPDDVVAPAGGDLTGDGTADLLGAALRARTVRSERSGDCGSGPCRVVLEVVLDQRVAVLDGRTGLEVQAHEATGRYALRQEVTRTESPSSRDDSAVLEVRLADLLVPLAAPGGTPRLGLQRHDAEHRSSTTAHSDRVAGLLTWRSTRSAEDVHRARSRLELRGPAGRLLAAVDGDWVEGSALATGLADLTGDGSPELLVVEDLRPSSRSDCSSLLVTEECTTSGGTARGARTVVRDGRDLAVVWQGAPAADVLAAAPTGDLDRDGAADLLEVRGTDALTTVAVSGRDGRELWRRDGYAQPVLEAPLGGGPGPDLVLAALDGSGTLAVERVDGASGTVLLRTTHTAPALPPASETRFPSVEFVLADLSVTPDVDQDGVADLVLGVLRVRFTDQRGSESATRAAVEATGTGAARVLHDGEGSVVVVGGDDLDGDRRGDVLRGDLVDGLWTTRGLDGDLRVLWSAPGYLPSLPTGDLDGRPGSELLGPAGDGLVVRDGRTHAVRWTT